MSPTSTLEGVGHAYVPGGGAGGGQSLCLVASGSDTITGLGTISLDTTLDDTSGGSMHASYPGIVIDQAGLYLVSINVTVARFDHLNTQTCQAGPTASALGDVVGISSALVPQGGSAAAELGCSGVLRYGPGEVVSIDMQNFDTAHPVHTTSTGGYFARLRVTRIGS